MVQNAEEFNLKYGWIPRDDEGIEYQINLGNKNYTEGGFIAWSVYECTVTSIQIEAFIEELENCLTPESFAILDNAKKDC